MNPDKAHADPPLDGVDPTTKFVHFQSRQDRPRFLRECFPEVFTGSLLDVGCDKAVLREHCQPGFYVGIDRSDEADVRLDLMTAGRLPFDDRQFDAVLCSDVLEHLENLHEIFDELVRCARTHVLVTLPNNWNSARRRLQRGKGSIAHYGLPLDPPPDRHRWFFGFTEALDFYRGQARRHGLAIERLVSLEKPRPAVLRAARQLAKGGRERYRNLFVHTICCLYRRA